MFSSDSKHHEDNQIATLLAAFENGLTPPIESDSNFDVDLKVQNGFITTENYTHIDPEKFNIMACLKYATNIAIEEGKVPSLK